MLNVSHSAREALERASAAAERTSGVVEKDPDPDIHWRHVSKAFRELTGKRAQRSSGESHDAQPIDQ